MVRLLARCLRADAFCVVIRSRALGMTRFHISFALAVEQSVRVVILSQDAERSERGESKDRYRRSGTTRSGALIGTTEVVS